jgi:hypothetical protein
MCNAEKGSHPAFEWASASYVPFLLRSTPVNQGPRSATSEVMVIVSPFCAPFYVGKLPVLPSGNTVRHMGYRSAATQVTWHRKEQTVPYSESLYGTVLDISTSGTQIGTVSFFFLLCVVRLLGVT